MAASSIDSATACEMDATWVGAVNRAVELCGTPCYVTRAAPILRALNEVELSSRVRSWLSYKTHPIPHLMKWWIESGRGVEVVSEAELATALAVGCPIDQLLVNGIAKHWLSRVSIAGLRVHFDSLNEVRVLLPHALRYGWRVGIRLHAPDERDSRDEAFAGPFGMTAEEADTAIGVLRAAGADVQSVHFHLGQRRQEPAALVRAVQHAAAVCDRAGFRPRFVDCGGGLPLGADAEPALEGLRAAVQFAHDRFSPQLEEVWLENGKFLTAQSSVLAVRVIDIKERPECRYVICDGGRTNQALAADNGIHPIFTLPQRKGRLRLTTICGPTCMTDDVLARVRLPDDVAPGDVIVWTDAGAYHLPWETRFSHGLCAVAWCDEGEKPTLARRRERPDEWVRSWNV